MSAPNEIPRDRAIDAAWRAHSTELPPPHVDAAILAAAHREAHAKPQAIGDDDATDARGPSRAWWTLAAAATIAAIAFGIAQLAPPATVDDAATVASDMPRASSSEPQATVPPASPVPERAEEAQPRKAESAATRVPQTPRVAAAPAAESLRSQQKREAPAASSTEASKPPAAPPPPLARFAPDPSPPHDARVEADRAPAAAMQAPATEAAKAAAPAPSATRPSAPAIAGAGAPAPAATMARQDASGTRDAVRERAATTANTAEPQSPDAWSERVRALFDAGRLDEAARELQAFRRAHADADARLAPALRAWAATVPREP